MNQFAADINNAKRFLRGGTIGEAFQIEEDAFEEHHHEHTHEYHDVTPDSKLGADPEGGGVYMYDTTIDPVRITSATLHGRIVAADLSTPARTASETRPKNIKVVYLMKCWHL